ERHHALVGRRTGRRFQLGQSVTVRLVTADALTGGITLELRAAEPLAGGEPRTLPGNHAGRPNGRPRGVKGPPRKGGKPTKRGKPPKGRAEKGGAAKAGKIKKRQH